MISGAVSIRIIVYGYLVTRSIILGVVALFVAAMILTAFTLPYLMPRIRAEVKTSKTASGKRDLRALTKV